MPEVAAEHGVRDVHDPRQNIAAGTQQLSHLMSYYGGDLVKSLAAYNAGEARGRPVRRRAAVRRDAALRAQGPGRVLRQVRRSAADSESRPSETFRGIAASQGRSVQWVRDARTNRVILTTKGRPAPRRLG